MDGMEITFVDKVHEVLDKVLLSNPSKPKVARKSASGN